MAMRRRHELILTYGAKPGPQLNREAVGRNMTEYEDQYAAATSFLIRFNAREAVSTKMLMASPCTFIVTKSREVAQLVLALQLLPSLVRWPLSRSRLFSPVAADWVVELV